MRFFIQIKAYCYAGMSLLFIHYSHANESNWIGSVDGTYGYDNNVSRAQATQNIIADQFIRLDSRLAYKYELAFNKAIIVEAQAAHQSYEYSPSLDQTELTSRIMYRWQNSFGYSAPWYQALAEVSVWETPVTQRNSNLYKFQLMASARLTTNISWVIGLESKVRDSDGTVFDTQEIRLFGHLDYKFRSGPVMYGGASYVRGDTFSSVQSVYCNGLITTDIYPLIVSSDAIEWDQAFSNDYCGTWISYRLSANTILGTLGVNYPISSNLALDASVMYVDVQADNDIEYQRQIFQFNLLKAF